MEGYRRIYYDTETGNKIFEIGFDKHFIPETVERDISKHKPLSERNRDTFDVLELPYGAYQQDFAIATGYRVNVETKELLFQYLDENDPETEQPYVVPFTEEIDALKDNNAMLFYDSMMKDSKIVDLEDTTSILAYELVVKDSIIDEQSTALADLSYSLMLNGVV